MHNRVQLIGNVGKDPEIRSFQSGDRVASFSVATSERWKDKQTGERKEKTEWHNVSVFSEGLIKVIESYVKKGTKLYLSGKLETRKWQDQSGNDRYSTEVVLRGFNAEMVLLDSKSDDKPATKAYENDPGYQAQKPVAQDEFEDEIPF